MCSGVSGRVRFDSCGHDGPDARERVLPGNDVGLLHLVRKHRFLNGREHLVDVFAGYNQDWDKDLLFYLLSLEMLDENFARSNSHQVGLLHPGRNDLTLFQKVDKLRNSVKASD